MTPLEQDLYNELIRTYEEAGKRGYWAHRFLQKVRRDQDPVKTCIDLLKHETEGFRILKELNELNLSVERLVLRAKFANLFPLEVREVAHQRLRKAGGG